MAHYNLAPHVCLRTRSVSETQNVLLLPTQAELVPNPHHVWPLPIIQGNADVLFDHGSRQARATAQSSETRRHQDTTIFSTAAPHPNDSASRGAATSKANIDELLLDEDPAIQRMARMADEFREIRASDDHGSLQSALRGADAPIVALLASIQSIMAMGGRQNTAFNLFQGNDRINQIFLALSAAIFEHNS
jgi:hypothetical protein